MQESKRYYFYPKIQKVFGLISLILISCFIVVFIYSFHPFFLIGCILISFFTIFLNLYIFRNGMIIEKDKIIYFGLKEYEFEKSKIEVIDSLKNKAILIKYNGKNYRIVGFFDFLGKTPKAAKNEELILLLKKSLK